MSRFESGYRLFWLCVVDCEGLCPERGVSSIELCGFHFARILVLACVLVLRVSGYLRVAFCVMSYTVLGLQNRMPSRIVHNIGLVLPS